MIIINEAIINKEAVQLIANMIEGCYSTIDDPDGGELERGCTLMTLGEIRGVTEMVRLMNILNEDRLKEENNEQTETTDSRGE